MTIRRTRDGQTGETDPTVTYIQTAPGALAFAVEIRGGTPKAGYSLEKALMSLSLSLVDRAGETTPVVEVEKL